MTAFSIEDELRERAALDAYARTMSDAAIRVLRAAFRRVVSDLATQSLSLSRRAELVAFLSRASATLGAAYQDVAKQAESQLLTLARIKAKATGLRLVDLLGPQITLLTAERIDAIVRLPIMDLPLGEWWKREALDMTRRVRATLQTGLLQGRPLRDIAREIAGTMRGDRSAYRAAAARAQTVTRTTASAVASATDRAVFVALGPAITDRYMFRATMDKRTSAICRTTDGRVFRYTDADALMPPLHANCRSTIIPLLNTSRMELKQRQRVITAQGTDGRLPPTRTPAQYTAWLNQQPPRVLSDILGKAAPAWKAGELTLPQALAASDTRFTAHQLERAIATPHATRGK